MPYEGTRRILFRLYSQNYIQLKLFIIGDRSAGGSISVKHRHNGNLISELRSLDNRSLQRALQTIRKIGPHELSMLSEGKLLILFPRIIKRSKVLTSR